LPNPASVYCEEQGGTLEIRENQAGQYGVCIFDDGSECDEWAYYRGECAPVMVLGQPHDSQALVYEGRTVAVFYEPVMASQVEIGFRGDLLGAQPDTIPDDVLAQLDQIVMTLTLLPQGE
jgi:hypothetical protein